MFLTGFVRVFLEAQLAVLLLKFVFLTWLKLLIMFSHRVQAAGLCRSTVWWLLHGNSKPECPKVLRTHGGECRPSAMSDSEHWASPCMTARPRRKRSAYDWALKRQWQERGEIQRCSLWASCLDVHECQVVIQWF